MIVKMADSASPWRIPEEFTVPPQAGAAYVDGRYAWSKAQRDRFGLHISITTDPASGVMVAELARAVDLEFGDYTASQASQFIQERIDSTHWGEKDATVYCSRDKLRAFLDAHGGEPPRWWIATLDGKPWTPQTLAEEIATVEAVHISVDRIWAIQNMRANGYDVSDVFGVRDFDRHH